MRPTNGARIKRRHLSWQVFAGLVLILLLMMAVAVQYIHRYTMDFLTERDEQIAYDQIENAQSRITQIFDGLYSNIDMLMFDSDSISIAKNRDGVMDYAYYSHVKALHARLDNFAANYDYIHSIYVYINDSVLISTNVTNAASPYSPDAIPILQTPFYASLSDSPYQTRTIAGFAPSDFHAYRDPSVSRDAIISLGCASGDTPGGGNRVIIVNLSHSKISALLASLFGEDGTAYLLNSDQSVLCASDRHIQSGEVLFTLPDDGSSIGNYSVTLNGETGHAIYSRGISGAFSLVKYLSSSENLSEANTIGMVFLAAFSICCVVSLVLVLLWIRRCLKPIDIICAKMVELESGNLGVQIDIVPRNELGDVIWHFNRMSTALADVSEENLRAEKALHIQEIRALRAQLNPHFIFNTLNMLKWMAIAYKADDLRDCIVALAEILHPAFKETSGLTTLKSEIDCLDKYIFILTRRFGNQVDLKVELPNELKNASVPRLIMQPLVENCVHHGRYGDQRSLSIHVRASAANGVLVVTITDDGQGIPQAKLRSIQSSILQGEVTELSEDEHIGLLNVHRRIALQYGRQYGVNIQSVCGEGTTVHIQMPLIIVP